MKWPLQVHDADSGETQELDPITLKEMRVVFKQCCEGNLQGSLYKIHDLGKKGPGSSELTRSMCR